MFRVKAANRRRAELFLPVKHKIKWMAFSKTSSQTTSDRALSQLSCWNGQRAKLTLSATGCSQQDPTGSPPAPRPRPQVPGGPRPWFHTLRQGVWEPPSSHQSLIKTLPPVCCFPWHGCCCRRDLYSVGCLQSQLLPDSFLFWLPVFVIKSFHKVQSTGTTSFAHCLSMSCCDGSGSRRISHTPSISGQDHSWLN